MKHRLVKRLLQNIQPSNIFTLIDVGSMGGIEAEWKCIDEDIKVVGFEPDEREFAKLLPSSKKLFLNIALSQEQNDLKFYVSREPGNSSIYKPNFDKLGDFPDCKRFETVSEHLIPASKVSTLDIALRENQIRDADFLKLDTQGSELSILKGGCDYLKDRILGLKVEVEFVEMYRGQPLFADVDGFIQKSGFQLMDLRRAYFKRADYIGYLDKGQMIFGDVLYFKEADCFFSSLENEDHQYVQDKIIKFIAACLVYGASNYAVFILNQARERSYITDDLQAELFHAIKSEEYRLKNLIFVGYNSLKFFYRRFRRRFWPRPLDWADGDSFSGNPMFH